MSSELYRKYQAEIERLNGEIAHYDRQWARVPQFAWAALLCPVVGYVAGWGALFVALLVTAALVGVRAYLVAVRKSENVWTRDRLLEEVEARGSAREQDSDSAPHAAPPRVLLGSHGGHA